MKTDAPARSKKVGSPLFRLTQARFLEFSREPSAVFWTFGFPILLTLALGFAFRNQKPVAQPIGLVGDDGRLARALSTDAFKVSALSEEDANRISALDRHERTGPDPDTYNVIPE